MEKIELKFCKHCNKKMPPIGLQRENGKCHNDWESRELHKKCFKEIEKYKRFLKILHPNVTRQTK